VSMPLDSVIAAARLGQTLMILDEADGPSVRLAFPLALTGSQIDSVRYLWEEQAKTAEYGYTVVFPPSIMCTWEVVGEGHPDEVDWALGDLTFAWQRSVSALPPVDTKIMIASVATGGLKKKAQEQWNAWVLGRDEGLRYAWFEIPEWVLKERR